MKADTVSLFTFLEKSKTIFNIPVYQRNYEWSKEQCEKLFKDLEEIIENSYNKNHFVGTIVYVYEAGNKQSTNYIIIDGQQRVTTFMILLKAIYDEIESENTKEEIKEEYLINKRLEENNHLKLKSVEKDRIVYSGLILEGKLDSPSKIIENYKYFKQRIKGSNYSVEEIYKALSYIEIVYIELNSNIESENPQVIFESINSTGLSLSAADLIRNFILMGLNYTEQTYLYNNFWTKIEENLNNNQISNFVRDYLTMKTGVIANKTKIYEEYKQYFQKNAYTSRAAIESLYNYSKYYNWLLETKIPNFKINRYLGHLNKTKATIVYPYFLKILKFYDENFLSLEEVESIFKLINSYFYRRIVCDKRSNALNKLFSTLAFNAMKNNEYERLEKYLMTRKSTQIYPRNEEFKRYFKSIDFYSKRNSLGNITLQEIENYKNKEMINMENIQVEHIMPQTLSNEWKLYLGSSQALEIHSKFKDTIGNLTLTGYNPELSNKIYTDKCEAYKNSNITITRDLVNEYEIWNEKSINERANKLFETAVKIWDIPNFDEEENENRAIKSEEYSLEDDIRVSGTKPFKLIIDNKEISISSWKEMLVKFLESMWDFDADTMLKLREKESLKRLFCQADRTLRSVKLKNGLEIETNYSSEDILSLIRIIAKEYEISDLVSFRVR